MNVMHWDSKGEGPCSEEALRSKMERLGYEVTRYVYPAGVTFPMHSHPVDKIDGVVSGRFRIGVKEGEVLLEAGDMIEIPCGQIHSAEVVGEMPVISLDGIKKV